MNTLQPKKTVTYRHFHSKTQQIYADWRVGATKQEKLAHRTSGSIMLSFDDYGSPAQIRRLLKLLNSSNVQATFFLLGQWALEYPDEVEAIRAAGHIVGNHSLSHPDFLKLDEESIRAEITQGVKSKLFRPPMGRYNARIRKIANELGVSIAYWTIDSEDWKGVSIEYMRSKILRTLHPGAVILFHIHNDNTIRLLPQLIKDIRNRGFELEALRPNRKTV